MVGRLRLPRTCIKNGYRRIGLISGPESLLSYANRKRGYLDALNKANLPVDRDIIASAPTELRQGELLASRMLDLKEPPDAFFCLSDLYAFGALKALSERRLNVPKDFGLMGFSNEDFTEYAFPTISTVDQFSERMGTLAAKSLIGQLENQDVNQTGPSNVFLAQKHVLSPKLVIRDSTRRIV